MAVNSANHDVIVHFARQVLGCQCADEVFSRISLEPIPVPAGWPAMHRIAIGGRLLIHVAACPSAGGPTGLLAAMVSAGRHERDRGGFNRFRLVLCLLDPNPGDEDEIRSLFRASVGADDKAHLHFVTLAELQGLDLPQGG